MSNTKTNKTEEKIMSVTVKNIPQSPQKLRLVANTIRGESVVNALNTMKFLNRKGTIAIKKALESGIANAQNRYGIEKEDLIVSHISVDGAKFIKKPIYATKGRFSLGKKRRSHLNLELKVK